MNEVRARWHVTIPSSWRAWRGAGVLVAASAPAAVDRGVTANVLVARERMPHEVDLEQLARGAARDAFVAVGECTELGSSRVVVDDAVERLAVLMSVREHRTSVELAQLMAYVAPRSGDTDGCRDVLQVVGTCALDDLPWCADPFLGVVESIRQQSPRP